MCSQNCFSKNRILYALFEEDKFWCQNKTFHQTYFIFSTQITKKISASPKTLHAHTERGMYALNFFWYSKISFGSNMNMGGKVNFQFKWYLFQIVRLVTFDPARHTVTKICCTLSSNISIFPCSEKHELCVHNFHLLDTHPVFSKRTSISLTPLASFSSNYAKQTIS